MLLGITGFAGCGKDTVGNYIKEIYGYKSHAFADPIKVMCSAAFGIPLGHFYDRMLKEDPLPIWNLSPRKIMQLAGTEAFQTVFGKDVWIKRAQTEMERVGTDRFVLTDVRFEPEAEWIRKEGGKILHIVRKDMTEIGENEHLSEAGIEFDHKTDFYIQNDSTIPQLHRNIDEILEPLLINEDAFVEC